MGLSLKGILGAIAPTLARLLPGPLGGMAKSAVTSLLGIKSESTEAEIEKTLAAANPDLLLKLKELDAEFQEKMKQLDLDLDKLAYEDTASARQMQMAMKSKTPATLSAVIVTGWIAVQAFLLLHGVPPENRDILTRALGIFDSALVLILGFWFGSSAGSARKDATIHGLSK